MFNLITSGTLVHLRNQRQSVWVNRWKYDPTDPQALRDNPAGTRVVPLPQRGSPQYSPKHVYQ